MIILLTVHGPSFDTSSSVFDVSEARTFDMMDKESREELERIMYIVNDTTACPGYRADAVPLSDAVATDYRGQPFGKDYFAQEWGEG